MKLQKIEDRLPLIAALVILVGVTGAAGDALADDAAIEIATTATTSTVVAGS
jgi:hypothetical protein